MFLHGCGGRESEMGLTGLKPRWSLRGVQGESAPAPFQLLAAVLSPWPAASHPSARLSLLPW